MRFPEGVALFRDTFQSFNEDKAPRLGAALSYYTVFSIPPLLLFLIGLGGLLFGHDATEGRVVGALSDLVGQTGASAIQEILRSANREHHGLIPTIVGVFTLLLGASGVFGQIKDALDTIWEVAPRPGRGIKSFLGKYVFSIVLLIGTGFLLLVSLALNALLAGLGDYLARILPGGQGLWGGVNALFSLVIIAFLFALMFRFIPDGRVCWKDALIGGALTSLLFTIGEILIGFYLGRTNVGSAFGAAGSFVVLLVWVYYSSMIFFFGAEFTKTYALRFGDRIAIEPHAAPVTQSAREHQGIPRRSGPPTARPASG
jgi:membrane protein